MPPYKTSTNLPEMQDISQLANHRPALGIEALISIIEDEKELLQAIKEVLKREKQELLYNHTRNNNDNLENDKR